MSTWRERVWPTEEQDLRLSRIDARQIAQRRKERKRRERLRLLAWAVGISLWVCLTLWIALGR